MRPDLHAALSARDGFALWLLAFAASTIIGTHGIAYWDAGDYTLLAITGGKSGLLLGRPLFLWISRLVLSAGVDAAHAEPVLRWFWATMGAVAAPALAVLAARLGLERRVALIAGAALALSPSFAHTSHQVLTDAPALALSICALACAAAGRPWRTGLLLAAAIATRETAALHIVPAILLLGARRGIKTMASCAAALAAVVVVSQPPGLLAWFDAMSRSISVHSWRPVDLLISLGWVLGAGPLPVMVGAIALTRPEIPARVRTVALPAAIGTILLMFYPDGAFSPRYVLATAPIAFFIAAAPWMTRRKAVAAAGLVLPLILGAVPAAMANAVAARGATLFSRIPSMPYGAVVVPGHFCPQARLASVIAKRPDLRFVCPGWDWPSNVADELDSALGQGRPIAIDIDEQAWVGRREERLRDDVRAWTARRVTSSVAGFAVTFR